MPQLIEAPSSDSVRTCTPLAYLEGYDAVLNDDYAFAAYKETAREGGSWCVRISSRHTAGAVFEPEAIRLQARSAGAQGKPYFIWGYNFTPSADDPRCIEFRVHQKEGKADHIEMYLQLRKADGSAAEPISVSFPWPVS